MNILILALVLFPAVVLVEGCAETMRIPDAPTVADVPVAAVVDCKRPDPGPAPDLSALASLQPTDPPERVIDVATAALRSLAADDQRLRALMAK